MRRTAWTLGLISLLLVGCSQPQAPSAPMAAPTVGAPATADPAGQPVPEANTAPPADQSTGPASVDQLNDQAFRLIQQQNWPEAVAAAQRAVKLDPNSAAAHFNLGRAFLGQGDGFTARSALDEASRLTEGTNADIEYYRGKAAEASSAEFRAALIYQGALRTFSADKEIKAALTDLRSKHPEWKVVQEADVDLDGKPDRITLDMTWLTITGGNGQTLYDASPWGDYPLFDFGFEPLVLHPLPDLPPLIHVQGGGCPAYYQHRMVWFDPVARQIKPVDLSDVPCSLMDDHNGDGVFGVDFRTSTYMMGFSMTFRDGHFIRSDDESRALMTKEFVTAKTVEGFMNEFLLGITDGAEQIFENDQLYEAFRARTAKGTWRAGPVTDLNANPIHLPLLQDGQPAAMVFFSPIDHLITKIEWRSK